MPQSGGNNQPFRKVVVIGGSGLIGSYIVRKCLREGLTVRATHHKKLDPDCREAFGPAVEWVQADILNVFDLEDLFLGFDAVINTAAIISFDSRRKKDAFRLAREGTANIIAAAVDAGIQKLVHVSSVAALGRKKAENIITEKDVFSHSSFDTSYGLSKFLAEQEVWRGHFEGLPVTILNPSMVIGAGPWGQSSTKLITSVHQGLSYFPTGSTGFVDVRDVAQAAYLALSHDVDGQRFIINAENHPYESVFKEISRQLNTKNKWKVLAGGKAALAWRWSALVSSLTGKEPVITKENVKSTSTRNVHVNTKSLDILGLSYRPVWRSIEETCRVFREKGEMGKRFAMVEE